MQLKWTKSAAADLTAIADYLVDQTPLHAPRIVGSIYAAPEILLQFPFIGRPGSKRGTRELVLTPLPYIVVYAIGSETVHVVRILHGAQHWP